MDRLSIPFGLLFSSEGSYGAIGQAMLDGAMLAVEEINADPASGLHLLPVICNPAGRNERYVSAAHYLLQNMGLKHVIGCYTSSSRKEVLPVFEKHDAILWYPSHYEGFESSDNVVYTGAAPNQHVVPLAHFLLGQGQRRCLSIGSNYIWAWENNRILREILLRNGGQVLAERYLPVGETAVGELVELALRLRPDFIFSTLIGDSACCFLSVLRRRCRERGIDQPVDMPVASCNFAETELMQLEEEARDGHLTSSVYFSSIASPRNLDWTRAWAERYPGRGLTSADSEASYVAVHALAAAARRAGSLAPAEVLASLGEVRLEAPQGPIRIDAESRHAWLWPRIGRSRRDGSFEVIHEASVIVRPDPYLVWEPLEMAGRAGPQLKVVTP